MNDHAEKNSGRIAIIKTTLETMNISIHPEKLESGEIIISSQI